MTCAGSSPARPRLYLALEACESALTIVLAQADGDQTKVLAATAESAIKRASETLAPRVQSLLAGAGVAPGELSGLAVVRGPGSFTGIRIVLAFAAGLAAGTGLPQASLDYLPLLAAAVPANEESLAVLTYARSELTYFQAFGPDRAPLTELRVLSLEAAEAAVAALPAPRACLGSALHRLPGLGASLAAHARLLSEDAGRLSPGILAAAAISAEYAARPVEPLYARPSDAEDNLASFASARGLDLASFRPLTDR